jgi:hypothetical protein
VNYVKENVQMSTQPKRGVALGHIELIPQKVASDFKWVIQLYPTNYEQPPARARAAIGRQSGVEFFDMQVLVDQPDGTEMLVLINTVENPALRVAGRIMLCNNQGRLLIARGPFSRGGIESVTLYDEVRLVQSGVTLAKGSF